MTVVFSQLRLDNKKFETLMLAVIGLICLLLMFNFRWVWFSDDANYRDWADPTSLFAGSVTEFLRWRLSTWTSRIAIEATIFTVVNRTPWWRLLTALAFWIATVVPPFLVTGDRVKRLILMPLSGLLILSIPSTVWFDAGPVATTGNYLYSLATGLLAAIPAVFILQNRRFRLWWLLPAILGVVYAGSSELVSALLLGLYVLTLAIVIGKRNSLPQQSETVNANPNPITKGSNWLIRNYIIIGSFLLFLLGMVLYHVFSPGNAARGGTGFSGWRGGLFPIMVERGYSATLRQIFMSGYLIPLVFFIVLAIINYRNRGFSIYSLAALIPVAGSLLLRDPYPYVGTTGTLFSTLFRDGNLLWDTTQPLLVSTFYRDNLLAFLMLSALLICAIIAIFGAFKSTMLRTTLLVILGAGFASKFITVHTIGQALSLPFHRTDLYLLMAFTIATLIALNSQLNDMGTSQISVRPRSAPAKRPELSYEQT